MDSPVREMEEFVLVPDAADLQLDEDAHEQYEARVLAGNDEKTIENYFSSEPTSRAAAECGTAESVAPPSGVESEGSVDDDVEAVDGGLSLSDEGLAAEEVGVAQELESKDGEGDHGWQQHAVGVIGTAEAAAPSGAESEGSVDDDVEAVDGRLYLSDEGLAAEEVVVAEEPECMDGDGDHGRKQHAVGVFGKVGLAAAAWSEGSVDDDVEADNGRLSSDEGLPAEEVVVGEEAECKVREGDHGTWQQQAVGVICKAGLAAAFAGFFLFLGDKQQTRHAGDRKAAKISARRDARPEQGRMSVVRFDF